MVLSKIVLEVLFGIEMVYSFIILIFPFFKVRKEIPNLVSIFSIFWLTMNVCFTQAALLGYERGNQVPVVTFVANELGVDNSIIGLLIALILMIVNVMMIAKTDMQIVKIAANFYSVINEMKSENTIPEEAVIKQKDKVQDQYNFFSRLVRASKFLRGSTRATIIIILINLLGGIAIELVKLGVPFNEALEAVVRTTTGNILVFLLPSLFISFALGVVASKEKEDLQN